MNNQKNKIMKKRNLDLEIKQTKIDIAILESKIEEYIYNPVETVPIKIIEEELHTGKEHLAQLFRLKHFRS